MSFLQVLDAAVSKNNSLLSIGLDPDLDRLPSRFKDSAEPLFDFSRAIIDATAGLACAYKPNSAFYEARGAVGIEELKKTCDYLREHSPGTPIILDYKRGDIGNTSDRYASFAFDYLGVDAVTVQPYLGQKAVQPFLDRADKGIIVLCKTSNEGSGEFQDLKTDGRKLYQRVAESVSKSWNSNGNCLLVVGATYPEELAEVRALVGDMVLLVPGIGAQGGDVGATVKAGLRPDGRGLIINSARAILYASGGDDFADAARTAAQATRDEINKYREAA